ncbi:hypothetical protein BKA82DRAFT_32088 [Pisolithus tinctorius]|uniref:Uncharacterized protein n=1 Tax=Pisolithus tinctorius Marx 270 TaxID=870435 RepID=A0A0C3IKW2_PISTI|nr:hypothetical protein BKA82DRAFT_32088 [Pisolithus tinctorius]KIN97612.1 hypothetical protein M404DRAFT_32088 [Pisolithus tinctorius Marx 270]
MAIFAFIDLQDNLRSSTSLHCFVSIAPAVVARESSSPPPPEHFPTYLPHFAVAPLALSDVHSPRLTLPVDTAFVKFRTVVAEICPIWLSEAAVDEIANVFGLGAPFPFNPFATGSSQSPLWPPLGL